MAYTTETIKNGAGTDVNVPVWVPGRGTAAESSPVVLSAEDKAAIDAIQRPGPPRTATRPTLISVQTPSVGTNWAAFASQACTSLDLVNTGVASTSPSAIAAATNIRWRYVGTTTWEMVREGSSTLVFVNANANEVEVQRADGSNTQITVQARAYA